MSIRSDSADSECGSSSDIGDLEFQLYSLVHYAADSLGVTTTEDSSREKRENHIEQSSEKEDVNSAHPLQCSSQGKSSNSDPQSAAQQNELACTKKDKYSKRKHKKEHNVIDYLTLLKEYKAAKAGKNFAEMSRSPSLLWCHKRRDLGGSYRPRYWMKEPSDNSNKTESNYKFDSTKSSFSNSSFYNSRNEESCNVKKSTVAPVVGETDMNQQVTEYAAFQAPDANNYDDRSPAKKPRNSLDTVVNHINPYEDSYEIPYKKKKKKKKQHRNPKLKRFPGSNRIYISSRNSTTSQQNPIHDSIEKEQNEIANHNLETQFSHKTNNDIDSRYNITPMKEKGDDVIMLDSSDSESSVIVLDNPPTPEPPPVICLDSDSDYILQHQEPPAADQDVVLNIANPKQPLKENAVENLEMNGELPNKDISFTYEGIANNAVKSKVKEKKKHHNKKYCQNWTAEMMSFYNESWGGERFDVISLQRGMSDDPEKWHVSQRDFQMATYKRKEKCINCSQYGHANWLCPEPPRPICCKMCGEKGHTEPRCPFPICLQCGERTMIYVRSCNNCRIKNFCTVCNKVGHSHDLCPEVWRRYSKTTSPSHVWKKSMPVYKPKEQQWCCVCARKGHPPEDCRPFFIEPITFQNNFGIHTPKSKKKKYKDYYKKNYNFGVPC